MCSLESQRLENLPAYFSFQVPECDSPVSRLWRLLFCTAIAVNMPYFMKHIASATSYFLYACYIVIGLDYYIVCVCV